MGRISGLSDELLIKILSFLPTKVAVSTSVLSKQWEFLWMWLPKLEFGSRRMSESESERLQCFLFRNLPLHRAPVIESFRLKIPTSHFKLEDIKLWVLFVVSRDVREVKISGSPSYEVQISDPSYDGKYILPSSLYTCKFLVTLKLERALVDVPRMVCLPSLKTLRLKNAFYVNKDSLQRLLSNCPVLEYLFLFGVLRDDTGKLIVMVPSLQRLRIEIDVINLDEFVIDTPSLKYLKLESDLAGEHLNVIVKNMPKLSNAFLEVLSPYVIKTLIGSISSVQCLTLCLLDNNLSEVLYDDGFVFNKLRHMKLCTCQEYSANVLVQLLKVSPCLQVLELIRMEDHDNDGMKYWNEPSTVPKCMLSSLEIFKWSDYDGSKEERELGFYILENARRLKTATISSKPHTLDMLKELALSSRVSTTCQLIFD